MHELANWRLHSIGRSTFSVLFARKETGMQQLARQDCATNLNFFTTPRWKFGRSQFEFPDHHFRISPSTDPGCSWSRQPRTSVRSPNNLCPSEDRRSMVCGFRRAESLGKKSEITRCHQVCLNSKFLTWIMNSECSGWLAATGLSQLGVTTWHPMWWQR